MIRQSRLAPLDLSRPLKRSRTPSSLRLVRADGDTGSTSGRRPSNLGRAIIITISTAAVTSTVATPDDWLNLAHLGGRVGPKRPWLRVPFTSRDSVTAGPRATVTALHHQHAPKRTQILNLFAQTFFPSTPKSEI